MKMKLSLGFLIGLAVILTGAPAFAQDASVLTPGAQVYKGPGGISVVAPGVNIQTPSSGTTEVATPNTTVATQPVATATSDSSYANATLEGMDFSGQNHAGANFINGNLTGANFVGANLANAVFANATLENVDFSNATLAGANLTNANLSGSNLTGADLSNADLTNANLDHALIVNTRMAGAILTNANMANAIHQAMPRSVFVNAKDISAALKSPTKKIDLTINFDFNSDRLSASGARQIKEIASALNGTALQNAHIMVEGHTDSIGSDKYNEDLSYRRAIRVARTLVEEYGIPPARLSSQGFGKSRPIASNDDDLGRARNRRVTLVNMGQ
jgi:outer membrane protein OmpA-like peptidoglycan-associated protein